MLFHSSRMIDDVLQAAIAYVTGVAFFTLKCGRLCAASGIMAWYVDHCVRRVRVGFACRELQTCAVV